MERTFAFTLRGKCWGMGVVTKGICKEHSACPFIGRPEQRKRRGREDRLGAGGKLGKEMWRIGHR